MDCLRQQDNCLYAKPKGWLADRLYLFCAIEDDSIASVPLPVIRLQLQSFAEAFFSFGIVRMGELKKGPALLPVHLWMEVSGRIRRMRHLQSHSIFNRNRLDCSEFFDSVWTFITFSAEKPQMHKLV